MSNRSLSLVAQKYYQAIIISVTSLTIIISGIAAFVGLESDSLWVDELFSAYFSDRDMPNISVALERAAEDVNPPGYYLLLWSVWRTFGGEFEITARALSATLGCIAVFLVILAPPRHMPVAPRLIGAAYATASQTWFFSTQEARSYALSLCFVTLMVALTLRCISALRAGRMPGTMLISLTILSCAAIFVHYYLLMVAGALFTVLLLNGRTYQSSLAVVLAGLFTLSFAVALVTWHQPQIIVDISDTWFSADIGFLVSTSKEGVRLLFWNKEIAIFSVLLALCMAWAWRVITNEQDPPSDAWQSLRSIASSNRSNHSIWLRLLITVIHVPMLGSRFFHLLAPLIWISASYGAWLILMPKQIRGFGVVEVLLVAAIPPLAWDALKRTTDTHEPWRHSANAVAKLDGCVEATLPVLWWEQPYFSEDDPERFYGFYLPPAPDRAWIAVPRDLPLERLKEDDIAEIVQSTASGVRRCPLLLWVARSWPSSLEEEIFTILEAHLPSGSNASVSTELISPRDGGPPARLLLLNNGSRDTE